MSWFSISNNEETPRTDEEILIRSISRPWEFSEIVQRYQTPFLRKALSIVYNQADAEEIVQDTFTKIYINANRFVPTEGATFRSWAYRILINTACTCYTKRRKENERAIPLHPEIEQLLTEGDGQTVAITRDAVDRMLAKLPNHFSVVLRLHYIERWPQQAIAEELGESAGTIKVRVHRAKKALAKLASKEWDSL
jgi:RNA polymerase sigma-70 factor (ECF subfamily)